MSPAERKRMFLAVVATLEARGTPVTAIRISPDGTVTLLTGTLEGVLAANDDQDWVSLAGAKDLPRA